MCCQEPLFSFLQSLEGALVVDSTGDLQALDHSRQGPAPEKADPSETVRAAAAKILAEFPHETNDHFLRAALPGESSSRVRRELLAGLVRRDPADGNARNLVESIAGNDPSNNIREYAEKLLR